MNDATRVNTSHLFRFETTHGRLKLERFELLVSLHNHLGFREPGRWARNVLIERFFRFAREHLVDEHGFELMCVLFDRLGDSLKKGATLRRVRQGSVNRV